MTALPPNELITRLEQMRSALANDRNADYYPPYHPERSEIDGQIDDLIEFVRAHMDDEELDAVVKDVRDPDLKAGDVIKFDGRYVTVRMTRFRAPFEHPHSPIDPARPVLEIVTSAGSEWFALYPQR